MEAAADKAYVLVPLALGAAVLYFWNRRKRVGAGTANPAALSEAAGRSGISKRMLGAQGNSDVDIAAIAAECAASGKPWKDPSFGHDSFPGGSIGDMELRDGERGKPLVLGKDGVSWQPPSKYCSTPRPMGVRGDGTPTWLYSDADGDGVVSAAESMAATDIIQGGVGDCYFLSALAAAVSQHPDLADDLVDETYEEHGIYGVSFFVDGYWKMVWVDGFMPCYRPSGKSHSGKHKLIFGKSTDNKEIWPMVVEKAFAKMHGSYAAISGGQVEKALSILTGGKGQRRSPAVADDHSHWQKFKAEVLSDEYFVGAGSLQQSTDPAEAAEQKKFMKGIVTGHAYTVLNIYQDAELRLLELRNPWGTGEWKGDWGAGSRKWNTEEGRKAAAVLGPPPSQDGRFWMSWVDFAVCFDSIDTCHLNLSPEDIARREALKEQAAQILTERERPAAKAAGGGDGKPARTRESADAMMELLLAEEAKEKRMKSIGARGNKRQAKGGDAKKKNK